MPSISSVVATTPNSAIRKVFNKAIGHDEWVKFTVGEPNFDTPANVVEAAHRAMLEGNTHYVHNAGILALRRAIAKKLELENGILADPQTEIMVGNGGTDTLFLAMQTILNSGDEVILPDPGWTPYPLQTVLCHARAVPVPVLEEDGFMFNIQSLQKSITDKTKVIILNSPANPTGGMAGRALLEQIAQIAIDHDLFVISDEVYEKLKYDANEHISIYTLPGMRERTIVINSFSKSYAMTGWRIGYAVANETVMRNMVKLHELGASCTNVPAQYAAIEALKGDQSVIGSMLAQYGRRREMMISGLNAIPGISCIYPKGTFYAFANIKASGLSTAVFCSRLMEENGVVVIPGDAFGAGGEGFIRLSFATADDVILEGLNRMDLFMRKCR